MKVIFTFGLILSLLGIKAQSTEGQPKLVVGIVVDQMRNDYLARYADVFGDGGFNRLISKGFYCANNQFSYLPTYTAPGHASIYTGTTPSVHRIVSNDWYDPELKKGMYCVQDRSVRTIGIQNDDGQMSPRNLRTSTITDELRLFWNFRSKVVGVSIKDRGAILPAGHLGTAYWFSKGNFISSSYYMDTLPDWVSKFNSLELPQKYLDKGWQASLPTERYTASMADENIFENILAGENTPLLPKDLSALSAGNGGIDLIKETPFGNSLIAEFAKQAVISEGLGQDDVTDFLAISFSSTDYVGHAYGPRSVEIEDTYIKLDRDLADLLAFLDQEVGKNNYLVFLTADHGAAEVGPYSTEIGVPGGLLDTREMKKAVKNLIEEIHPFGKDLIEEMDDFKIYFDRAKVAEAELDLNDLAIRVANQISKSTGMYHAYVSREILGMGGDEFPIKQLRRGLYPSLSGDVIWVAESGYMHHGVIGTTHGSPWKYDTHVPLLFYGKGVKHGKYVGETDICDIAPTLSMLLNIPLPSGTTGSPILPLFD